MANGFQTGAFSSDIDSVVLDLSRSPEERLARRRVQNLERHLHRRNEALLAHRYFRLCDTGAMSRPQLLGVVRQLYCFSIFFERILTARIAEHASHHDGRVLRLARAHLREEIGHAELFERCLSQNGVTLEEIASLAPRTLTKAVYGYLLATVQHEHELVTNVAVFQVMEGIGYHFFRATLPALERHALSSEAFARHAADDEGHQWVGLDLVAELDDRKMADCKRVIDDLYRLMTLALDDWLDAAADAEADEAEADE